MRWRMGWAGGPPAPGPWRLPGSEVRRGVDFGAANF